MSKTILLADDSVTIQKVIELTFMDQDHRVETVGSGDAAIARLGELKPDFVITDVHMPGADGYEVARRSKALYPDVPVLLLVGTFEPFDEGELASSGADRVLKKPFDSQELMRLVDEMSPGVAPPEEPAAEAASPFAALDDLGLTAPTPSGEIDPFDFGSPVASSPDSKTEMESVPGSDDVLETEGAVGTEEAHLEEGPSDQLSGPEVGGAVTSSLAWDAGGGDSTATDSETDEDSEQAGGAVEESDLDAEQGDDGTSIDDEAASSGGSGLLLSDDDIERIARRVAELVGEKLVRQVAWDVIPDMAEVVIKERLQELESQVE